MGLEIDQTVEAVRRTFVELQHPNSRRLEDLVQSRDLVLLGTGASLAMARCAEALYIGTDLSFGGPRKVFALEAAEALFAGGRILAEPSAAVVIVSKSGKTRNRSKQPRRRAEPGTA